jgi:hypothetical protein
MKTNGFSSIVLGLFFASLPIQSPVVQAAAPVCYPYNGTGYCQYSGRVVKAYVNAYDQILLYFDTPVDLNQAASVGLTGATVSTAAIYNMSANRDFGKMLYATLVAAQARGANVEVQMHSVSGGYLVMDRVWIVE